MLYTIKIRNISAKDVSALKIVDLNTISSSISSPQTPYDDYVSDTISNLDGSIQIPVYDKNQYVTLPKDSMLEITTEDSDQAIFYYNAPIKNGTIEISPNPVEPDSDGSGVLVIPYGVKIPKGTKIKVGPKSVWHIVLQGDNLLGDVEYYRDSLIEYDGDMEVYNKLKNSNDKVTFEFGDSPAILCFYILEILDDFDKIDIFRLFTFVDEQEVTIECMPYIKTSNPDFIDGKLNSVTYQYFNRNNITSICMQPFSTDSNTIFNMFTYNTQPNIPLFFINYDEKSGILENSLIKDLQYTADKSIISQLSILSDEENFQENWYTDDEILDGFVVIDSKDDLELYVSGSGFEKIYTKIFTKTDGSVNKSCLITGNRGMSIFSVMSFEKSIVYIPFKENTYYLKKPTGLLGASDNGDSKSLLEQLNEIFNKHNV
jgi:hypothetical protein